jgi:two-component system, NtrC family, sensor kinase
MFEAKPSIRQKITFGYYAFVAMVIGLSVITLAQMEFIQTRMIFGAAVHEFLDTVLEIRRFEKNYLLYERESDYQENIRYIAQAHDLLVMKSKRFDTIASPDRIQSVQKLLDQYRELMDQHFALVGKITYSFGPSMQERKNAIDFRLRSIGDGITTAALDVEMNERKGLIEANSDTQKIVIASIAVLAVLAVIAGRVLSRIVLQPLQRIEKTMDEIADGKFVNIQIGSHEQEIVSLTQAFNRMIRELELRQRHLVQSEKLASLGTLLSGVAHELNNPLSNISSSGQILAEELREVREKEPPATEQPDRDSSTPGPVPLDPAFAIELVSQINEQTDRARNIVRSLLEFTRTTEFKKQSLPLRDLLEETIRFVKGQMPKGVTVTLNVPYDLAISADKQRIQQAFLNLINNAIEAVPGEGVISIYARKQRAVDKTDDDTGITTYLKYRGKCTIEDDTVDIEIRDNGTGIPAEILPKVFDPFFSTKDVGKGSGLGLYIVHEIIEEHDGCIAVSSEPGKGTTFLIRLPVK